MKCILFYCNIAHELKGTVMKTKRIWVSYMIKFLWPAFYRCSVRAPWVARQMSYLYSVSIHALLSKSRVNVATASLILPASSSKVVANGGTYTTSLMYRQRKESRGVRSGERGGQVIGQPLPIHFSGNLRFKKSVTSLCKCGGAPS
jgi:hypothetical protein